ncbi:uncharacterized protein N7459_008481 [Penicillium hispanicum]|uniref:uncharacterized protein n=1 Tax=Penicillium hispanicum TaxID=1080232 RepID=UPI0025421068|nr:uncharacterized protein N7459_008481 [Penicillium hispanicum]KAJ5574054.1 hypothetical protein N7459_008481 [Penicillium hispanicum]
MLSPAVVELWVLYSVGVTFTLIRTYARVRAVGWRDLAPDDYLIWVGIVRILAVDAKIFYTAQTALAYTVTSVAFGLANSGMTDAERAALSIDDPEYHYRYVAPQSKIDLGTGKLIQVVLTRVVGSKIQVAGWVTYMALIASLKLSMMAFYVRLTDGLGRRYRIPVYVGFVLVSVSFLASIITAFAACQPFHKYWQINPNPGNICQPAISKAIVWVTFIANIVTDPYLIFIPIPMLWQSSLKLIKKVATTIVLGAGIFVLVCATLKSVFLITEPLNGAEIADSWGTRETFVAVITTNLPMIFHLCRSWLARIFGSVFQSSRRTYKSPSGGFRSIGGSELPSRSRRGPPSVNPITENMTFSESEERIVGDMKMQNLKVYTGPVGDTPASNGIVVSNQIEVTHETRSSHTSEPAQNVHETW